jgi:hypothetical protein
MQRKSKSRSAKSPKSGARRKSTASPANPGAKVGRGNPPKHTRFKKGVSGNIKGRPKGSKNLSTILMEAARARITAIIDGKPRRITKLQATAYQLANKAASGDQRAIANFLDWINEIEHRAAAARPAEFPFGPGDLEVVRAIHKRMNECADREGAT